MKRMKNMKVIGPQFPVRGYYKPETGNRKPSTRVVFFMTFMRFMVASVL